MNDEDLQTQQSELETEARKPYEAPKVLASYNKQELEELMTVEGDQSLNGCGCGSCGGGS